MFLGVKGIVYFELEARGDDRGGGVFMVQQRHEAVRLAETAVATAELASVAEVSRGAYFHLDFQQRQ